MFALRYSDFELDVFSRNTFGRGDSTGYHTNFLVGGGSPTFGYETGFGFGRVESVVADAGGMPTHVDWKYLGMPFRLTTIKGPLRFALTYEWNWLKYGVDVTQRVPHVGSDGMTMEATKREPPVASRREDHGCATCPIGGGVTTQQLSTPTSATTSPPDFPLKEPPCCET